MLLIGWLSMIFHNSITQSLNHSITQSLKTQPLKTQPLKTQQLIPARLFHNLNYFSERNLVGQFDNCVRGVVAN